MFIAFGRKKEKKTQNMFTQKRMSKPNEQEKRETP